MEVFSSLFNDWVGILSFGVIAATIVIAVVFLIMFVGKSAHED
jgi:hypothetical protein